MTEWCLKTLTMGLKSMAEWGLNELTITGPATDINELRAVLSAPYETQYTDHTGRLVTTTVAGDLLLMNMVAPTKPASGKEQEVHRCEPKPSSERIAEGERTGAVEDLRLVASCPDTYKLYGRLPAPVRKSHRGSPETFPMRLKVSLCALLSGGLAKTDARDLLLNHVGIRDALRDGLMLLGITHGTHPAIVDRAGYLQVLPSRRTLERAADKYPDLSSELRMIRSTAVAGAVQAGPLNGSNSDPVWGNVAYQDGAALPLAASNMIPRSVDLLDDNIATWGTRWEVRGELDTDASTPTQIKYTFESAWEPPVKAVSQCAAAWPSLTFTHVFWEPGCDFGTVDTYIEGQLVGLFSTWGVDIGPTA